MVKTKMRATSVAGNRILERIKPGMPQEQVAAIEEAANQRALIDVYGEGFQVDSAGNPQEQGIGSTQWLLKVDEGQAERHYAAIGRFVGPAAEKVERERVARLRGKK